MIIHGLVSITMYNRGMKIRIFYAIVYLKIVVKTNINQIIDKNFKHINNRKIVIWYILIENTCLEYKSNYHLFHMTLKLGL